MLMTGNDCSSGSSSQILRKEKTRMNTEMYFLVTKFLEKSFLGLPWLSGG